MSMDGKDYVKKYEPLWGSWHVHEFVGEGSFGKVYKIIKGEWGYTYESALKIMSVPTKEQYREAAAAMDASEKTLMNYFEDSVRNIVNEIRVLYSLRGNSNIVGYEDHMVMKRDNPAGWDILIRMEYLKPLSKYLMENSITKKDVIKIGMDICSALEVCSQRDIIHRDIKDENIFVSEYDSFKLGDFGISRELSRSGRAASMKGTPIYMAPEVLKSEKYDIRADLYSLGIVLYRLLNCGRIPLLPPYPEEIRYKDSEAALDRRISGETLPLPLESGRNLGSIILKACSYNPGDRYSTAHDMKEQLKKVLDGMDEGEKNFELNLPGFRKKNNHMGKKSPVMPVLDTVMLENAPALFVQSNREEGCIEHIENGCNKALDELHDKNRPESVFDVDKEVLKESNTEQAGRITDSPFNKAYEPKNEMTEEPVQPENKKIFDERMNEAGALIGAVNNFGDRFKKRKPDNSKGNSAGNIINGGIIATNEFWIYYSDISTGNSLCKMKHDGSGKTGIVEDEAWYINISGNWIYFSNASDEESIYKIDLDGNNMTKLNSDKSWDLNVIDDWIYYSNESDGYRLYRIKTDGSMKTRLNKNKSYCMNIQDDWIYFSNKDSCGSIFKMRTDGSGLTRLNSDDSDFINVSGGYIYYCNKSDAGRLYRIDIDGGGRIRLSDDFTGNINVSGDLIYYCNKSDGEKLYRIKADGSSREMLCSDSCDLINVTDNWIFYCNKVENNLYKIQYNGTGRTAVGDQADVFLDDEWYSLD